MGTRAPSWSRAAVIGDGLGMAVADTLHIKEAHNIYLEKSNPIVSMVDHSRVDKVHDDPGPAVFTLLTISDIDYST